MLPDEAVAATKPGQGFNPLHTGGLVTEKQMIRRVGILAEVGDKAVFLRIPMNVMDQSLEIAIGGDCLAAIAILEQAARAAIGVVNGFAVGVEEVSELLAGGLETSDKAG